MLKLKFMLVWVGICVCVCGCVCVGVCVRARACARAHAHELALWDDFPLFPEGQRETNCQCLTAKLHGPILKRVIIIRLGIGLSSLLPQAVALKVLTFHDKVDSELKMIQRIVPSNRLAYAPERDFLY